MIDTITNDPSTRINVCYNTIIQRIIKEKFKFYPAFFFFFFYRKDGEEDENEDEEAEEDDDENVNVANDLKLNLHSFIYL